MKALFAAVALLTAVSASAQSSQPMPPPPGMAVGTQPPTSSPSLRGGDDDDDNEFRRGRHGTLVVVEREELEQRLARLERLLGDAFERGGRGNGRGKLRQAYEELNDIRDVLADAPEARGYNRPRPVPAPTPAPPPAPVYYPIAERELQRIMSAMAREPFGDDKMNVLEDAVGNNYFTVNQVLQVLPQFKFSKERLDAVRVMWSRVLDRQNGFQLYNAFQFSNDKAELKRIING